MGQTPATNRPTAIRLQVLGLMCGLSMITYLDRACYGEAMTYIQADLGFDDVQKGWLFFAFSFAYAFFEVPSGWLGDRFGPKGTLLRIVLGWSLFTALTGLVFPVDGWPWFAFAAMFAVRFLFGAGEAGAYPNIARALHNWFPALERGRAQGWIWCTGRFMGGLAPLAVTLLVFPYERADGTPATAWRHVFWIFGALGVVWCLVCWRVFKDRPEQDPRVNATELATIQAGRPARTPGHHDVPWLRLLSSGNLWALCLMYASMSYAWYFFLQFYPQFLRQQLKITPATHGLVAPLLAGVPLLVGAATCLWGGFLSDFFVRRLGNRRWGRRVTGIAGHGLAALAAGLSVVAIGNPVLAVALMALVSFGNDLTMGSCWAVAQDIGGKHTGVVSGCMNTIGNIGGALAPLFAAWALSTYGGKIGEGGYPLILAVNAGMFVVAVLCWFRIDATEPVAD